MTIQWFSELVSDGVLEFNSRQSVNINADAAKVNESAEIRGDILKPLIAGKNSHPPVSEEYDSAVYHQEKRGNIPE